MPVVAGHIEPSSLSDLKNRSASGLAGKLRSGCSQNSAGRGQILRAFALRRNACLPHLPVLQVNSRSIDQKSGEICTVQPDVQPISFNPDNPLGRHSGAGRNPAIINALRSRQNHDVVPLTWGIFNHLDSGLRRNDAVSSMEALIYSVSGMKRKEPGAQKARHIIKIGELSSTARRSDSPVQPINQRFPNGLSGFKSDRLLGEQQERNIFTSRYQLHLPTVEELENELRRELRYLVQPECKVTSKRNLKVAPEKHKKTSGKQ